jgi:hypothetical protein
MGRRFDLMSARPVSNEMSLGISSFSWLSCVCVTATPVPTVARCMACFFCSMCCDQT